MRYPLRLDEIRLLNFKKLILECISLSIEQNDLEILKFKVYDLVEDYLPDLKSDEALKSVFFDFTRSVQSSIISFNILFSEL